MNKSFVKFDATTNELGMNDTKGNDSEKELLYQVFEKIKREKGATSNNNAADMLEILLLEEYKFQKSSRTLVRNYNQNVLGKDENCGPLTLEVNNYFAKILGFEDFSEFVQSLKIDSPEVESSDKEKIKVVTPKDNSSNEEGKSSILELVIKNAPYVVIVFLIGLVISNYFYTDTMVKSDDSWMVWKTDHYEEFNNEIKTLNLNSIKLVPYNKKAILEYRKIELDCESSIKKVWYYKVNKNELEFFNFPGLHPINGKTLKEMNNDMKKKYICDKEITNN